MDTCSGSAQQLCASSSRLCEAASPLVKLPGRACEAARPLQEAKAVYLYQSLPVIDLLAVLC